MPTQAAGILVFRKKPELEVFIVHNGGPFFTKRDNGFWSIPKGLIEEGEEPIATAKREFEEETGMPVPTGELINLGVVTQVNNKQVHVWAVEGNIDPNKLQSNFFEIEWPPKSGKTEKFPEIDRGQWFNLRTAASKMNAGQAEALIRLAKHLNETPPEIPGQVSF